VLQRKKFDLVVKLKNAKAMAAQRAATEQHQTQRSLLFGLIGDFRSAGGGFRRASFLLHHHHTDEG
jgi:hypothetical protein